MDPENTDQGKRKEVVCKSSRREPEHENNVVPPPGSLPVQNRPQNWRYTLKQIEGLKVYFQKNNLPNESERKKMAKDLGLTPSRVLYWFQNKRTSDKHTSQHIEKVKLRNENAQLQADNIHLQEMTKLEKCATCLKALEDEKAERHRSQISAKIQMAKDSITLQAAGMLASSSNGETLTMDSLHDEIYKSCKLEVDSITTLAISALDELQEMATFQEPQWLQSGPDSSSLILNLERYFQVYKKKYDYRWTSEASRQTVCVTMNPLNLVHILMDGEQWSNFFPDIVSRASVLDVIATGENYDGALYVMRAELHVQSPFIPTRQIYFLRYCKHCIVDGMWIVVDISFDNIPLSELTKCQKRASGCMIKEMENGHSQVTWLEHFELDQNAHNIVFESILVDSHFLFGANRWCGTLARRCQRWECLHSSDNHLPEVMAGIERNRNLLKLSERMVNDFYSCMTTSGSQKWRIIPGSTNDGPDKSISFMTRVNTTEPGTPPGVLLVAVSSFRLGAPPQVVFSILQNIGFRSEWDMFTIGYTLEERARIFTSIDEQNHVSLMGLHNGNCQSELVLLQESYIDAAGALIVYCLVPSRELQKVVNGENQESVCLQSSGFSILGDGCGGSLITNALQYSQITPGADLLESKEHVENNINQIIQKLNVFFGPQ